MKTVVSYLGGIPKLNKNPDKTEVLTRFAEGVNRCGDRGVIHAERTLVDNADVALLQGWVHKQSGNSKHLEFRRLVIAAGPPVIAIDSNLFQYTGRGLEHKYLRFSRDGIFPTTGNYFWDNPDSGRWNQICKDLKIIPKPWRADGRHILICTQRNGGWSMSGLGVVDWLKATIKEIRRHTNRPIVVRGHPGDKHATKYLREAMVTKDWLLSTKPELMQDLAKAWAVVTYNSSPGAAAAIEGIPVFVTDTDAQRSQAFDVCNTSLSQIEDPAMPDRDAWFEKIAMCHWKFDELSNGKAWEHMRQYF